MPWVKNYSVTGVFDSFERCLAKIDIEQTLLAELSEGASQRRLSTLLPRLVELFVIVLLLQLAISCRQPTYSNCGVPIAKSRGKPREKIDSRPDISEGGLPQEPI